MNKEINFTVREVFKDEWIAKEIQASKFPFQLTKGFHIKRFLPIFNAKDIPDLGTKKMKLEMDLRFIEEKWQWKYTGLLSSNKKPVEDFTVEPGVFMDNRNGTINLPKSFIHHGLFTYDPIYQITWPMHPQNTTQAKLYRDGKEINDPNKASPQADVELYLHRPDPGYDESDLELFNETMFKYQNHTGGQPDYKSILRELAMRAHHTFPETEEDAKWSREGIPNGQVGSDHILVVVNNVLNLNKS